MLGPPHHWHETEGLNASPSDTAKKKKNPWNHYVFRRFWGFFKVGFWTPETQWNMDLFAIASHFPYLPFRDVSERQTIPIRDIFLTYYRVRRVGALMAPTPYLMSEHVCLIFVSRHCLVLSYPRRPFSECELSHDAWECLELVYAVFGPRGLFLSSS